MTLSMLALVCKFWRIVLALSGIVAASSIFSTARRWDVLEMPAFCKVSNASLYFESVNMSGLYQKCNRVATIIKLNPATCNPPAPVGGGSTEKIMLTG